MLAVSSRAAHPLRVSIDCRYVRERPSGIGAYVRALVDRLPALDPDASFHFWVDPRAPRPLSAAVNASESRVRAAANGLATLALPSRLVNLDGVDVLHAPFNTARCSRPSRPPVCPLMSRWSCSSARTPAVGWG